MAQRSSLSLVARTLQVELPLQTHPVTNQA